VRTGLAADMLIIGLVAPARMPCSPPLAPPRRRPRPQASPPPAPHTAAPLEPQAPLGPGRGAEVGTSWGRRHTADQLKFSFRPGSGHCILARRPESDRVM